MSQAGITSVEDILGIPLSVDQGGTGNVAFTPYAVITGGTTPTGPLQDVDPIGTLGQVLTSSGAGALPTWTTISGFVTSVSGTANRITSTGGTTPVIDISAAYVGQSSITTLGTITTGVWQGTAVGPTFGGTGQTTYTTGDILYASAANTLSKLAIGGSGTVLTVAAGIPSWATNAGGDVTGPGSSTDNALVRFDGTTGKLIQNGIVIEDDIGNISQSADVSGSSLSVITSNTSNTASATAFHQVQVAGGTASDAFYEANISGGQAWTWGLDNSASDGYALAASATLGTNNVVSYTTAGVGTYSGNGTHTFTTTAAASLIGLSVVNTDTVTSGSNASIQVSTGGTSSGTPYFGVSKGSVRSYSWGMSNVASESLQINTAAAAGVAPTTGTNIWNMTNAGVRTMPLQPAVLAILNTSVTNVTGNTTVYTVVFNTEIFDRGNNFNTGTGTFTAPVTGLYQINAQALFNNVGTAATVFEIYINATSRQVRGASTGPINSASATVRWASVGILLDMTAGDTFTISVVASGQGADTIGLTGDAAKPFTYVSCYLVA